MIMNNSIYDDYKIGLITLEEATRLNLERINKLIANEVPNTNLYKLVDISESRTNTDT